MTYSDNSYMSMKQNKTKQKQNKKHMKILEKKYAPTLDNYG